MIRYTLNDIVERPIIDSPHYNPASGMIWLDGLPERGSISSNTYIGSPALHEMIHLCQTFGTLFGRFLSSGLNIRSLTAMYGTRAAATIRGKAFLDLRAWRDDVDDDSELCIMMNRCIYICDRIERALGNFHGEPTISTLALRTFTGDLSFWIPFHVSAPTCSGQTPKC